MGTWKLAELGCQWGRAQNKAWVRTVPCFLLLNGISLAVTWVFAVVVLALWLLACDSLGLRCFMYEINFIILFPTMEPTHLILCWSTEQQGRAWVPLWRGPWYLHAGISKWAYLLGTTWYSYAMIYLNQISLFLSLVSFYPVLPTGPEGYCTASDYYYSAWNLMVAQGLESTWCFWFHITRQILLMQLPSIWRHRTPEPSKSLKG